MKITAESLQTGIPPEEFDDTSKAKFKKEKKSKKALKKETTPNPNHRHFGKSVKNSTSNRDAVNRDDDHDEELDNEELDDNQTPTKTPKSPKTIALIVVCVIGLACAAGGGTWMVLSSLSLNNDAVVSDSALSKEDQALLNSDDFEKDDEKRKGDSDIEVETPSDSMSDADRIVKLQSEIDRLKSELEIAQNASAKQETPVNNTTNETPPVANESDTVKDLKKQISDLQSSLSASQARESYLQNQLAAAKNDGSK